MSKSRIKKETGSEVVEQWLAITKPGHRTATVIGGILGGFVPLISYGAFHWERSTNTEWYTQPAVWVVIACLGFSFPKVASWGKVAFKGWMYGICFAILTEAAMITFQSYWLAIPALVVLVCINAVSAAAAVSLKTTPKPSWMQ